MLNNLLQRVVESCVVKKQRSYVLEENTFLWEIRNVPYFCLDVHFNHSIALFKAVPQLQLFLSAILGTASSSSLLVFSTFSLRVFTTISAVTASPFQQS